MSQTLNINYDPYAPGTFALTFTVNGVAPNLSTGYGATMRIWRSGLPTTSAPDVTVTAPSAIALGTSGSIILDLVVIHTALALVSSTEAVWSYDLIVTPTGAYSQKVCSGQLAEGVGSDAEADVSAPISVNWAGTVGGDLSGTLPNPTVDGLQGRTVASTAPTNGQVLAWNATSSQWEPTTGGGGSGTVTSITAGTGLTGGTITTSGTIAADIGTGATQVAAGNHTHTLAGDVQGDIGTTVVHKVQGYEFNPGAPSNGDVWVYESSSTKWKHENLATAGIAAAVHTHAAADIVSGVLDTARLASSGTASSGTYLRGDQTWSMIPVGSTVTVAESTYTSSGTWTKPTGCQYIVVEACGAGGGGGSGAGASSGGAGGCGGLYGQFVIPVSLLTASTCDVTVGTGGTAGNDGGDTSMNVALASTNLFLLNGGRGASNASYSIIGTAATNGFAAGGAAGTNGGRHGGYGPAGGGGGGNAASGGAGGRACSLEYAATGNVAAAGGGAAGGTAGNAGTTATTTIRGFGDGGGGGGGASTTAGGNGGNGTRGSGGGGGGGGTPVGTGGTGGDGFVRIISVSVT